MDSAEVNDKYKYRKQRLKANNRLKSKNKNISWLILVTILSFFLSAAFSFVASGMLDKFDILMDVFIVLFIVLLNIVFDLVGSASMAADEKPFHSMASNKVPASRLAVKIIRNADKVSSILNDVVGDICGIISGTATAYIVTKVEPGKGGEVSIFAITFTGFIASMTVGGKAFAKRVAIMYGNKVIYFVSIIIDGFLSKFKFLFSFYVRFKTYKKGRKKVD